MNREFEGDIKYYLRVIKKRWKMVIIIPLIVMLLVGIINSLTIKEQQKKDPPPPKYITSTTLLISNKSLDNIKSLDLGNLSNNKIDEAQTTYLAVARSKTLMNTIIKELGLDISAKTLQAQIAIPDMQNSVVFIISVTDTSSERAIRIANSFAKNFISLLINLQVTDNVRILDKAIETSIVYSPVTPDIPRKVKILTYALESLLLGLIISVGLALFKEKQESNKITVNSEMEKEIL